VQKALLRKRKVGSMGSSPRSGDWLCIQKAKIGISFPSLHVMGNPPPLPLYIPIGIGGVFHSGLGESAWDGVARGYSTILVCV